jgi:hypothetical protein
MNTRNWTEMLTLAAAVTMIALLLGVAAFAQNATFHFYGPLARVITPNGDGKNDYAIFCFDNPADSGVTGNIFTMLGSAVATLGPANQNSASSGVSCPAGTLPNSGQNMVWDGTSNGNTVHSGVYVYRIMAEQKSYTGTIVVVR